MPWLTAFRAYSIRSLSVLDQSVRRVTSSIPRGVGPYQSAPAFRCDLVSMDAVMELKVGLELHTWARRW